MMKHAAMRMPLAIVDVGAIGPLGLDARALSAAVWSNLARFTLSSGKPYGISPTLRLSCCPLFDSTTPGAQRMRDMLDHAFASLPELSLQSRPLHLVSPAEQSRPTLPKDWAHALHAAQHIHDGAAGWVHALSAISQAASTDTAHTLYALAGVDTLLDADTVRYLFSRHRLSTEEAPEGLVLGEAAAILLLCTPHTALHLKLPIRGMLDAACSIPFTQTPVAALTAATEHVLAAFDAQPVHSVLWDIAEDNRYLGALAQTLLHLPQALGNATLLRPSNQLGDVGAAFGPVAAVLALEGCRAGLTSGDRTLICTLHDGHATAVALTAPCRPQIMLQDAPGDN